MARREPFSELYDIDALASWYAEALEAAGSAPLVPRVTTAIAGLAGHRPVDYLDHPDHLLMAPAGDGSGWGHATEVVGAVLGYWPPTSAALLISASPLSAGVGDAGGGPGASERFGLWDGLRFSLGDLLDDNLRLDS